MPTPISHAAVGFALGAATQPGAPARRVCLVAAACAALPDIDVFGSPLGVSTASLFAHRAITHSLAFALLTAVAATLIFFRDDRWTGKRGRLALTLGLALFSHSCLDALSTYSRGVAFLAPFSLQRYRFLWTPLSSPPGFTGQAVQELVFLLLPALLVTWLAFRRRAPSGSLPLSR